MGALLLSDIWTNDLEGMWTDTDVDIMTEGDFDPDIGEDSILDLDTEPLRYEDYLRRYLSGDSEFSTPNADSATLQGAAPKTKEQIISELAPKIAKPGITPARAMMEAQRMYTEAEKIFGADTDIVPEKLQPDQNPRKFLDGFQNAYLSGKLGDKAALENSTAAAYLTEEQRETAFDLGSKENGRRQLDYANDNGIIAAGSVLDHFDRKIRLSDISEDLKKVNPNYSSREHQWTHNCQRCVATYEMRRRGFNVTAKPILVHESFDTIAKNWSKVWTNDPPLLCRTGNGKVQIEAQMKRWGDGARAIVCVKWKGYDLAHVFVAENRNGTIVYIDPQNGNENCSNYFSRAKEGCTQVLRVDKCTPTDLILECCQNVR